MTRRDPYTLDLFAPEESPRLRGGWPRQEHNESDDVIARAMGLWVRLCGCVRGFNAEAPASWAGGYSEVQA